MGSLASAGLAASGMVNQSYALLAGSRANAAQDPSPEASSALDQAGTQAQVSTAVLKKTLDMESATGNQFAQMLGQSPKVDLYA